MDYEEIDLMTDVCMLDVDLPTFLNDCPLPVDRLASSSGGGVLVTNGDDDTNNVYKSNTALNEFDHRNAQNFSQKSHYNRNSNTNTAEDANFYLSESIFSNAASEYTVLTPAVLPNASSPQQLQFVDAPWHENFIDVESDFASFLDNHPTSTNDLSFLDNIVWHAESSNNVDNLLDIVDQSAPKASSTALRDPQQIYEEIYRECEEIESRSDADSPPRFLSESEVAEGREAVVEIVESFSPVSEAEDDDQSSRFSTPFSLDDANDGSTTDTSFSAAGFADHVGLMNRRVAKKKWGVGQSKKGDLSFTLKKKGQNRVAASRYRSKRKCERTSIEIELQLLTDRNQSLKSTVDDLEREVSYLKNFLNEIRQVKKIGSGGVVKKSGDKRSKK